MERIWRVDLKSARDIFQPLLMGIQAALWYGILDANQNIGTDGHVPALRHTLSNPLCLVESALAVALGMQRDREQKVVACAGEIRWKMCVQQLDEVFGENLLFIVF